MSTRIINLTQPRLKEILLAWQETIPLMIDVERTIEACFIPLIEELNTQWYALPHGAFMLLRNTIPGATANVQFLTRNGLLLPELPETQGCLVEAMREFRLRRLTLVAPSPVAWQDFKLLGFKHEGRIRKSVLFDGAWTDAIIMGALEHEVGVSHRRRRKRYHPKRNLNGH